MYPEERKWRIYAPEGRDTRFDVKMNLRNSWKFAPLIGRGEIILKPLLQSDYGDDG